MKGTFAMNDCIQSDFSKFKQFHTDFLGTINEKVLDDFRKFNCDEERIKYLYSLPFVHKYEISVISNSKSTEAAKQFKEEGNHAFQANQFEVALELYSKGILKQPQNIASDREEISVMFANRSAAHYHIKEYELALGDIQTAFDYNYPLQLHYKIFDRKARCFLALNQLKSAQEAFRQTIQALDSAKLSTERRQKWQRDIQIMLAILDKNKVLANAPLKKPCADKEKINEEMNKQYPAASTMVAFEEAPDVGRFAEAKGDIQPGNLILREMPHCAVLLDQYSKSHCFQCLKRAKAPQPCPLCSNIVFCSKDCKDTALRTHHFIECKILPTLWESGASITCLMALRIITQRDLNYFLQLRPTLENSLKNKQYISSDYKRVYDLVNHSLERSTEDFLHRTLMAVFLLRCLQSTDYFKQENENSVKSNENSLTKNEKFIGGLILKHLQSLQFNSHEVSELLIRNKNKQSVFIGGAVYPTLALFNHSCNPGIVRYHKGSEVVVKAIRTIRNGEMIAENYGPIFTQMERKERQHILKSQYWFNCQCEACLDNWPTINNMSNDIMRFRCECSSTILVPINTPDFMIACQSCNNHANIFKGLKALQDTDIMFRVGKSLADEGNNTAALNKFIELLAILDKTLVPPFPDYHLCQQEIRTCMLSCGNVHVKK